MDFEAHWVSTVQPQGREYNYPGLVFSFYSALRKLGFDVDVLPPGVPLSGYALVVVPSLPILSDEMMQVRVLFTSRSPRALQFCSLLFIAQTHAPWVGSRSSTYPNKR